MSEWMSPVEAARMLGYDPDYFLREFVKCKTSGIAVLVIHRPKRNRYRVLRSDIEALVASTKESA